MRKLKTSVFVSSLVQGPMEEMVGAKQGPG